MSIRCMIVDDEPLAIELIETHIASLDELELVSTCTNAIEAIGELRKISVDLLFLDIQMPKLNGIEFVKTLQHRPKIIITSAYQEYAYDAYQIDAIDYILKPITFERFLSAVNKALDKPGFSLTTYSNIGSVKTYIYIKVNRKMMKIPLNEILYIESIRDQVKIRTTSQKIIAQQKISIMEDKLPGNEFLRVHRSFIISLNYIKTFSKSKIEINDFEIPIGRSYKELVAKKLKQNK